MRLCECVTKMINFSTWLWTWKQCNILSYLLCLKFKQTENWKNHPKLHKPYQWITWGSPENRLWRLIRAHRRTAGRLWRTRGDLTDPQRWTGGGEENKGGSSIDWSWISSRLTNSTEQMGPSAEIFSSWSKLSLESERSTFFLTPLLGGRATTVEARRRRTGKLGLFAQERRENRRFFA